MPNLTALPYGRPSDTFTANPASTPAPFGFTFDDQESLVVTDAAMSALSTYTVDPNGTVKKLASQPNGQRTMCWVVPVDGHFYVTNTLSKSITGYQIDSAGTPTVFTQVSTREGPIDLVATRDGRFLYVQIATAGGIDGFRVEPDGTLDQIVTLAGPAGPQGIALTQ